MRRGTYSIVARDPRTGQLGVAVQSHWFSVGSIVSWAEPGVGAVATQSVAERSYGPHGLDLMRAGRAAPDVLEQLVAADAEAAVRQVALVDSHGRAAAHSGELCIPFFGHVTGDGWSCQANLMAGAGVPEAMAKAFEEAPGALDERLLAALDGGEAAGGDIRGRQSAALLVVDAAGERWERSVDLRVEDHSDPLGELRRLHRLHRAYALSEQAEEHVAAGRHDEAAPLYEAAAELAPENDELLFFAGVAAAVAGDTAMALERVRAAIAINPAWRELMGRIPPEIAPGAQRLLALLDL